jgi:transcriptional regulator with XRE-family HTH domain
MNKNEQLIQIRNRKIGALMCDARSAARRSQAECALVMGVTPEEYDPFEKGITSPSLPQLEIMAYYLGIPLEQFWSNKTVSDKKGPDAAKNELLKRLRDRIIGVKLRQSRDQANFTISQLSALTSISEDAIKAYELGQEPVPLPELEILSKALELRIETLFDRNGPIGSWRSEQEAVKKFLELSPEIQSFVCLQVNRPYLQLAMKFSEMSVEKLRVVAESLLEITY